LEKKLNNSGEKTVVHLSELKSTKLVKLIEKYVTTKSEIKIAEEKAGKLLEEIEPFVTKLNADSVTGTDTQYGSYELSKSLRMEKTYDVSVTKKIEEIKQKAENEGKVTMTPKPVISLRFIKTKDE
jgi:hypothetical protein